MDGQGISTGTTRVDDYNTAGAIMFKSFVSTAHWEAAEEAACIAKAGRSSARCNATDRKSATISLASRALRLPEGRPSEPSPPAWTNVSRTSKTSARPSPNERGDFRPSRCLSGGSVRQTGVISITLAHATKGAIREIAVRRSLRYTGKSESAVHAVESSNISARRVTQASAKSMGTSE